MKGIETISAKSRLWILLAIVLVWASAFPAKAGAQCTVSAGANAIWANCSGLTTEGSAAFIDAGAFSTSGDICVRIHSVLTTGYPASGEVIDARGIIPTSGSAQTCGSNPWAGVTVPSTVLLPAGIIQTNVQWVLPNGTRVLGMGAGKPGVGVTTLQATSTFPTGLALIRMGTASTDKNISVEDLRIDGTNATINGITNVSGQEGSYVNRVSFINIASNGLSVTSGAPNSGPYSDITFVGRSAPTTAICASILAPTRGIHGLRCGGGGGAPTAVLLDAPNNSLEDVQIDHFTEGIAIGKRSPTQSDVLFNILGGPSVTSVVHIYSVNSPVKDLSMMAIGAGGATNTIVDDLTSTTLPASSNPSVGLYALGEAVTTTGLSRFTTSPTVPTWVLGNTAIPANTTCAQPGSMYSNTTGTTGGGNTWYVCKGSPSKWVDIF